MTIRDLGELHGPLLFFGGPYSNLQATEAMRAEAERRRIPPDRVICTGDIVAYCAQPNETIELIRDWGVPVVMGNCEESIGNGADDCGCGFEEGSACDVLSDTWYTYTNSRVSADHRAWMRELPTRVDFTFSGKRFAVVHGSVSRINEFVFSSTAIDIKQRELAQIDVDGIVGGHCGLPFTQQIGDKLWHNPGVVGMPANDGTQRGWYSVWSNKGTEIRIDTLPLAYDAAAANQVMIEAGLINGYADGLLTGLWPSLDVLPDSERALCGVPLEESTTHLIDSIPPAQAPIRAAIAN